MAMEHFDCYARIEAAQLFLEDSTFRWLAVRVVMKWSDCCALKRGHTPHVASDQNMLHIRG